MARPAKPKPKPAPLVQLTTKPADPDEPVAMLDLFSIDDRVFQIPAEPRAELTLQLLDEIEQYGAGMANVRYLRKLLGEEGFAALTNHPNLRPEELTAISNAASNYSLGVLEQASGN